MAVSDLFVQLAHHHRLDLGQQFGGDEGVDAEGTGQRLMARDIDRQVAEVQVRVAVLNGSTAPGIPVTEAEG